MQKQYVDWPEVLLNTSHLCLRTMFVSIQPINMRLLCPAIPSAASRQSPDAKAESTNERHSYGSASNSPKPTSFASHLHIFPAKTGTLKSRRLISLPPKLSPDGSWRCQSATVASRFETQLIGKIWLLRNSVNQIITRVNYGQPRNDVSSPQLQLLN